MKLFWKIFAWFWGAMVLMGAALFAAVTATQPDPLPAPWRQATSQALSLHAHECARSFEKGGVPALSDALRRLHGDGRARLWLFDTQGRFLVREPLVKPPTAPPFGAPDPDSPDGVQRFDSFGQPDGAGPGRGAMPSHIEEMLVALAKGAGEAEDGEARFKALGRNVLVAQSVATRRGRYVLAGEMSSPPGGRVPLDSGALALWRCGCAWCWARARWDAGAWRATSRPRSSRCATPRSAWPRATCKRASMVG